MRFRSENRAKKLTSTRNCPKICVRFYRKRYIEMYGQGIKPPQSYIMTWIIFVNSGMRTPYDISMTSQSNPAIRGAMLSEHRKVLRLSAEAAEKIELNVSEEHKAKAEKQSQLQLETQINLHYDKAIQLIGGTQSQQALQEVQQAHRLYLSSAKAAKKADWIFRHLSDLMSSSPTT